jgi:alpha-ketoglutarate-dependent taurine dioxygenase
MTPQQLQILHPIHLGHQSPDNLYQKTHRATEKVRALSDRDEEDELEGLSLSESDETVSLLKILLDVEREHESE